MVLPVVFPSWCGSQRMILLLPVVVLYWSSRMNACCEGWTTTTTTRTRTRTRTTTRTRRITSNNNRRSPVPLFRLSGTFLSSSSSSSSSNDNNKKQSRGGGSGVIDAQEADEDLPAGIAGAEFFGGNQEKQEFFDPQAEEDAGNLYNIINTKNNRPSALGLTTTSTIQEQSVVDDHDFQWFDRFQDREAFSTDRVASLARQLQTLINQVLYADAEQTTSNSSGDTTTTTTALSYASTVDWITPFPVQKSDSKTTTTPLQALSQALDYYRRVDVAITAGRQLRNNKDDNNNNNNYEIIELHWELSVLWPTLWEPRVLLTGSSLFTLQQQHNLIVKQIDTHTATTSTTTSNNLDQTIFHQLIPRFWDLYHIGMTPSAEHSPYISNKGAPGRGYQVLDLPGRWMVMATAVDQGTRLDATANILPSHAFNTIIKTMGPTQQRYVATTPLEIAIQQQQQQQQQNSFPLLQWKVPISVEFQSQLLWPPAMVKDPVQEDDPDDGEDNDDNVEVTDTVQNCSCQYTWCPPRRVAVANFSSKGSSSSSDSGGPQDESIPQARKHLYDAVTAAGHQVSLQQQGRPSFFFLKKAFKACYTEQGLGMAVYEWRPNFAADNQIGLELQYHPTKAE